MGDGVPEGRAQRLTDCVRALPVSRLVIASGYAQPLSSLEPVLKQFDFVQ